VREEFGAFALSPEVFVKLIGIGLATAMLDRLLPRPAVDAPAPAST
jgi:hypothetical protein